MKFIPLKLTDINGNVKNSLDEIVNETPYVTVILGAPGSGKSRLLQDFKERNENEAIFTSVEDFLIKGSSDYTKKYLLLDGFDEYRNSNSAKSKTTITKELAQILEEYVKKGISITIACREMDWCGKQDESALCNFVKTPVKIFTIEPLDEDQKQEFKNSLHLSDSNFDTLNENGFLENPQLFIMSEKISRGIIQEKMQKRDLYERFIESCQEANEANITNSVNIIELDVFKKAAAYIAFYYMFGDDFQLNERNLQKIADAGHGFTFNNLNIVLKSTLIINGKFCHRTIAEYLAAKAIANRALNGLSTERIINLVSSENVVYSEYRGVYSWLCALLESDKLIDIDPYLQYQYGDNSFFTPEQKKKVIAAVRNYSEKDPYFYRKGFSLAPKSFYEKSLDLFLVQEYRNNIMNPNHYLFFLSDLLEQGSSKEIKDLAKYILEEMSLPYFYKVPFVDLLKDDPVFLKNILDKITQGTIKDEENDIREKILEQIYPDHVSEEDIVSYLKKYNKEECFRKRGEYLLKTRNNHCFKLAKTMLLEEWPDLKDFNGYPYFMEIFIAFASCKYLNEVPLCSFWKNLDFLMDGWHPKINYIEDCWRRIKKDDIQVSKERSIGILEGFLEHIKNLEIWKWTDNFSFLFDWLDIPHEDLIHCIKKSTLTWTTQNKFSLYNILTIRINAKSKDTTKAKSLINEIAKVLDIEINLNEDSISSKYKQDIENHKKKIEEQEKKGQEQIEKNEQWLHSFPEESWQTKKNLLEGIACSCLSIEDLDKINERKIGFKKDTTLKLLRIIKNLLIVSPEKRIAPESLTVEKLIESKGEITAGNELYYVSLTLNTEENFNKINGSSFRKYLYLITCHNFCTINIRRTDFATWFERNHLDEAYSALNDFIAGIMRQNNINQELVEEYRTLAKKENPKKFVDKAKHIIAFTRPDSFRNTFFEYYIKTFHVKLSANTLTTIENYCTEEHVKRYCQALRFFQGSDETRQELSLIFALFDALPGSFGTIDIRDLTDTEIIHLMNIMFNTFDTEDSIRTHSGIQDKKDECITFLRTSFWAQLHGLKGLNILRVLLDSCAKNSIWKNRIKNRIVVILEEQKKVPATKEIADLKPFILGDGFISYEDFFAFCIEKINELKIKIEDKRLNDQAPFFDNGKPKKETECRDEILRRLTDSYPQYFEITHEAPEGSNFVDMRVTDRKRKGYIVQVECKRDLNTKSLNTGINEQLIEKYFSSNIYLGIYLVFCFKKDPNTVIDSLKKSIPYGYKNKIEIICIDLRAQGK